MREARSDVEVRDALGRRGHRPGGLGGLDLDPDGWRARAGLPLAIPPGRALAPAVAGPGLKAGPVAQARAFRVIRTSRSWSPNACSTRRRGSGVGSTRGCSSARRGASRGSASTACTPAASPPPTTATRSSACGSSSVATTSAASAYAWFGLVGPAPGVALLRPAAGLGRALDVGAADLRADQPPALEPADGVPAPADQDGAHRPVDQRVLDDRPAARRPGAAAAGRGPRRPRPPRPVADSDELRRRSPRGSRAGAVPVLEARVTQPASRLGGDQDDPLRSRPSRSSIAPARRGRLSPGC